MRSFSTLLCTAVIALVFTIGCGSSGSNGLQGTINTSNKAITAFSFTDPPATGIINETTHAIVVTLPAGTPVTNLVATFTTTGASVTVGGIVQESGVTENTFSSPVVYTVTAADGTAQTYTVTISFSTISSSKAITAFSFTSPPATGIISDTTHAIAVTVPDTDVTALVATFAIAGASVAVGGTVQVSGVTQNNFTNPVVYTVTAADSTTQNYTVTVTIAPGNAFLTFALDGFSGTINKTTKTISIVLPPDKVVTALIAAFTVSPGATVTLGAVPQTSGVTQNDFTTAKEYTVTSSDNTAAKYTVVVTDINAPKLMTSFSFPAIFVTGVIDQNTISASVPLIPGVTSLVASYVTSTSAIVKVGSVIQTNGTTTNDFSSSVTYAVIAADGQKADYTVTVTINPPMFMSFVFSSVSVTGTIDEAVHAIAATVPASTDVTSLISSFTTTDTSSVVVGATPQTSGVTPNDFSSPVAYVLTGATSTNYTVTVTKAPGVLSLPRTGQTTVYSAIDDGMIQRGVVWPDPRFIAAGSMVTDDLTGLQWPQNADTPTFVGCTGGVMNWQAALAYVACLNTNSYLAQTDWRLPNANELVSLLTASVPNVYSWLNTQGFNTMQENFYFSSTTDPNDATQARIVNMKTGNSFFVAKSDLLNLVPVRGISDGRAPVPQTGQTTSYAAADDGALQAGMAWPGPRFTNPDLAGTIPITGNLVRDQLTGLIWTREGNTPGSATCSMNGTWQEALDYIACLNTNSYLGYNDWRLPNINELVSLVNAEEADSSSWLNAQDFSNAQGSAYWSSTTDATVTDKAWLMFLFDGSKYSTDKTDTGIKAWPVRSGF